ncbi:MAG: AMP-binding protein, partial [Bacteroidia bacterium]|nr:AMP-binding protein [Bacteroidia bacterium]
ELKIKKGAFIAILGNSMPNWPIAYLAASTSNRVAVPLLPDFTAFEIANILEHSEAKVIIISKKLIYKLTDSIRNKLDLIICMDTLEALKVPSDNVLEGETDTLPQENFQAPSDPTPDDLASLIYTSGTSGSSKGVMLSHGNLTSNIMQAYELYPIYTNDTFLSILPLSHAYECTIGMLYPFAYGSQVFYLNGAPTPSLLMPALRKVKPTIMLSVPLIVEKIYKNKVRPMFTKTWIMQVIYSIGIIRRLLHRIAGKKIYQMFGGQLRFFGIGGAKLDGTVERFLRDAKFPYAIGYGLTECSPLIAGQASNMVMVYQATGHALVDLDLKLINQNEKGIGEIVCKGPNIMKGYYKDPDRTAAAFTEDGYYRTKDLGKMSKDGCLSIVGRVDNMLIGPNGENIYPEEIESVINDSDFVLESLVTKRKDQLVALIHFNYSQIAALIDWKEVDADIRKNLSEKYEKISEKYEELYSKYEKWKEEKGYKVEKREKIVKEKVIPQEVVVTFEEKFEKVKKELLEYVNERVNKTSKISEIIEQPMPFQKTATQKIKRYLYK